jgi:hypothetical protein
MWIVIKRSFYDSITGINHLAEDYAKVDARRAAEWIAQGVAAPLIEVNAVTTTEFMKVLHDAL